MREMELWRRDRRVHAVNKPLQFFPTNPFDVISSSVRRRPAATVINFTHRPGRRLPVNAGIQTLCLPFVTVTYARVCLSSKFSCVD